MKNTGEFAACTTRWPNYCFEGRCEDCDARNLSRMPLEQVEDRFCQGRVTRNEFDAYRWVWALLSPAGSNPHWTRQPYTANPDVRRIARKLLSARDFEIPADLRGNSTSTVVQFPTQAALGEAS